MSGDWSLRLAKPEDAGAFAAVEEDAAGLFAREGARDMALPEPRSPATYRAMIAHRHCLAAQAGERCIGFAAARPDGRELHLHQLSVTADWQRRGVGRTLLTALAIDARNAGFRAITLATFREVAWNAPFFASNGYQIVRDVEARPRLARSLADAVAAGLPAESRCAMIRFLD